MRLALNFRRIDPTKGGAETYVADLCRSLIQSGHAVDLFAEDWVSDALPGEVRCVRVEATGPTRALRIWSFARNSEAALKGTPYDCSVGFINTWHHDVLIPQGGVHAASRAANARRFPAGWRRNLYLLGKRINPRAGLYRAIERRQYDLKRGTRVVAVSEMVKGHLARYHGVTPERVRVIPNAIDAARLAVDDSLGMRSAVRSRLGLKRDDLVGLFVGHNFKLKGLPSLLDAFALRNRSGDVRPIHLLVCGGGKIEPFRRVVRNLGLEATVHLIGFLPDVREGFHAADFFVSPTYYDPCSLVVFEALACGLPVITTACNGAGEVLREGREGFVIPEPSDIRGLANALDRMTDDASRREMSIQARRLGEAQSFENHVEKLVQLFEEVAASKRATVPHGKARGVASR